MFVELIMNEGVAITMKRNENKREANTIEKNSSALTLKLQSIILSENCIDFYSSVILCRPFDWIYLLFQENEGK